MFRNITRIAAAGALAGGLMLAQTPSPATPASAHKAGGMHCRKGHKRVNAKLMAGYLGLTADQQARAKAIRDQSRTAAQPIVQQLKQNRADLRAAIRAGKPVDQLAAERGTLVGKLTAIRANAREQFRSLLAPDQVQKLDQLRG